MIYKKIDLNEAVFCNVSEGAAISFIEHRITLKAPLTQRAFNQSMRAALSCEGLGITPDQAIDMVVTEKGWRGVVYEYIAKELNNRFEASAAVAMTVPRVVNKSNKTTLIQDLTDRTWAQ